MDDQSSRDFLKDLVMQQDDSDSETDEELAEKVAADREMYRKLFSDAVKQSELRVGFEACADESDFTAEPSFDGRLVGIGVTDEANGFNRFSVQPLPALVEDTEFFSGPAEWRHIWEWDVGECNRMISEQNTQQYDEVENCTDSDESVDDDVGAYCDDDSKEHSFLPCTPRRTWTVVGDSEEMANAVSSSVVVSEPASCTQSTDNDHAGAAYDREISDSSAIQSVLDDVVNSCTSKEVKWDSADESGLTELDRQQDNVCDRQFSQDFTPDSSEGRFLSMHFPMVGSSCERQGRVCAEDNRMDNSFISGFSASSMFAQRSSYSPGAHGRSADTKWNPPRTPPTTDNDSIRWKPRKSWRKNSADGLDSAGCSPKDDEDDDSDDAASENCGAAAMKQNKMSPASGYHAGSSYYYPMAKDKSWLARCDDRQQLNVPSENSSGCVDPSEDSYYSRYQRRCSDEGTPAGRGFSANSDAVMQRMMRRKQARRDREAANLTTADSVAGYRGRDCSIEELIEYIDAKPPTVPKTGQRQTGNRKKQKKKRGSNRSAKSENGDDKATTPDHNNFDQRGETGSNKTPNEKLDGQTVATTDSGAGTGREHETHLSSSGDDKLGAESATELPLRCDTFFHTLPSEGSSSNMSDADNASDLRTHSSFRNYSHGPEAYREMVGMPSPGAESDGVCVDDSLTVKTDSEPTALIHAPVTPSTETASRADVDEFGNLLVSSCSKPSDSTVLDKDSTFDSKHYEISKVFEADESKHWDEVVATDTENCSQFVTSSCIEADSRNGRSVVPRRHSEELSCAADCREMVCLPDEPVGSTPRISSMETGQSTPSSSVSDARDSLDFDTQSWADDVSSDFDVSMQLFHENDFTVVTQKKKKKVVRQNPGSTDCLRRTFYNRNHRDGLPVRDRQSSFRNESAVRESSTVVSNVPITCSSFSSNNTELCSVPVSQHSSTALEVHGVSEFVQSLVYDRQTGSLTDNVSSVGYRDHNVTNDVASTNQSSSARGRSSAQFFTNSGKTTQAVKDVKRSSADHRAEEKVFLDTRQPNIGAASADLSFWYDTTIPENQSASDQTDTVALSSSYDVGEPSANTRVSLTDLSSFSAALTVTSSVLSITSVGDVNTDLRVSSCTARTGSLPPTADDNPPLLVFNASQLQRRDGQTVTGVDDGSQTSCETSLSSQADSHVTLTAGGSGSHYIVSNSSHSGNLSSAAVRSSSSIVSASATDSSRHSSSHSRQLFSLRDTQLFLYNEFQQVMSAKCRNPEDTVYFADADNGRS